MAGRNKRTNYQSSNLARSFSLGNVSIDFALRIADIITRELL